MTNEQIVRDACRVIWSEGDTSRIRDFYADDYRANYPSGEAWGQGPVGAKAFADAIRAAFPDYHEEIEELVAAGDKVAVRLRITGTHRGALFGVEATGAKVDFRDMTICTLRNGKIISQAGLSDNFTLFQQLGLIAKSTQAASA